MNCSSSSLPSPVILQPRLAQGACALALLLLAAGCDRADSDSTPTSETSQELSAPYQAPEHDDAEGDSPLPFPSNDWSCDLASVDRARAWIDATRPLPADQQLAKVSALDPSETTPRLLIGITDTTLQLLQRDYGDDFAGAARAIEQAQLEHSAQADLLAEGAPSQPDFAFALRLDGPTSAERLEALITALEPSLGSEVLMVVPTAPPTSRAEAPSAEALERARTAQSFENCPTLDTLLSGLEARSPAARYTAIRQELIDAWLQCDCNADLEALLAAKVWPVAERQPVSVGQIPTSRLKHMVREDHSAWNTLERELRSLSEPG